MNKEEFQGFRERFNRFENGFNELVKEQYKKNEKWDKLTKQYVQFKEGESSVIKLDVGGTKFTTTKNTLLNKGVTYFQDLLSKSTSSEIYIDRPGRYFDYILNYLRGKEFDFSTAEDLPNLRFSILEEARFYGVNNFI